VSPLADNPCHPARGGYDWTSSNMRMTESVSSSNGISSAKYTMFKTRLCRRSAPSVSSVATIVRSGESHAF